ncbi:MAG TPA: hypothetical protein VGJ98_04010 [Candidatus Eisenbacteria bacterium]|jgi:hypothetical protein
MKRIVFIASIALAGLCFGPVAGEARTPANYRAPASAQAAWNQAREAYRRGDYRTYINTVSPDVRDECICHMSSIVSGAIGYELLEREEDLQPLNRILRRYGVLELEAPAHRAESLHVAGLWGRAAIARIRDKEGFYNETMRYLRKHKVGPQLPSILTLELSDVVVDGSNATGRLSGRPRLRPEAQQVAFERTGEAWFVRLPTICLNDKPEVDVPYVEVRY